MRATVTAAAAQEVIVRREFRAGAAEAIIELQERIYRAEHGVDDRFRESVTAGLEAALARGWPIWEGAVWLVEHRQRLAGCLAMTVDDDGAGRVRWFVLEPELRGQGLGRRLVSELIDEARASGLEKLRLDTFSALKAAAAIYRSVGFRVVSECERDHWGPPIVYQEYELELG